MKKIVLLSVTFAFVLSACGAAPIPTVDPAQVQGSAIAMVNTLTALTQAAITPTPLPTNTLEPTHTPQPSLTPSPEATLSLDVSPTAKSGTDPCNKPLSAKSSGDAGDKIGTNILIVNNTKSKITFSLYLAKNIYGDCGYVSYEIARGNSVQIANTLPKGCYYGHAYINDPKKPSQVSSGPDCITGVDKTTFNVTADQIRVVGP